MPKDKNMTKGRIYASRFSSLVVKPFVIIAAFAGAILTNLAGITSSAIFLFSLFIVGLTARLWGFHALRRIDVSISGSSLTLTVGDTTELTYSVENNKLLPLTWMELCLDSPVNGCVAPDSGFSLFSCQEEDVDSDIPQELFRRRILFLMSFQSISWNTVWFARRRGVYDASKVSLRSGDGFGLTRSMQDITADAILFVVWPKIVPVDTAPFFRNVWQGSAGRRGHVEDPTVLQGLRDYAPGDPWKRIDWRMAARADELMVKKFETILPSTIHFVLDTVSFLDVSYDNSELEESISVLASLILELSASGIRCGLSLPGGEGFPAVDISPDDPSTDARDLLNSLAALNVDKAVGGFDERLIESLSQTVGQLWFVTYSGVKLSCPDLAEKLEPSGFFAMCHDTRDSGFLAGRPLLAIGDVKKGGVA